MNRPDTRYKQRPTAVTHTLKSVRRHHIEFEVPKPPADDEECFVVSVRGAGEIRLRPGDYVQFINCLLDAKQRVMDGASSISDTTVDHHPV